MVDAVDAAARRGHLARAAGAVAALFAAVTLLPRLLTPGAYIDGMVYATIARNLAAGSGSLWEPRYTSTMHPAFHEHPPLGLLLESLPFRLLGDHFWVEKLFSALVCVLSLVLMRRLWVATTRPAAAGDWWLPLLAWMAMPLWAWLYANAMLETQVALAALAAACCVSSGERSGGPRRIAWFAAAAAAIVAGFWIKGPQATFPLAWPAILALTERRGWRRAIGGSALLTAMAAALFAATMLHPAARECFARYWNQQVVASLSGARGSSGVAQARLLRTLAEQLAPGAVAFVLCLCVPSLRRRALVSAREPAAWAFLALGACASLPILASPRFSSHYIGPSTPFLALGIGALLWRPARALSRRAIAINTRAGARVAAVAAGLSIATVALLAGLRPDLGRDPGLNAEVAALSGLIARGETIGADPRYGTDFRLTAYLARFLDVSLDASGTSRARRWYLAPKDSPPPAGFRMLMPTLPYGDALWAVVDDPDAPAGGGEAAARDRPRR